MSSIAAIVYESISKIEHSQNKEEIQIVKSDFKTKIQLAKSEKYNISAFIKAAIICGDFKALKLFYELFPKSFRKVAMPYRESKNKKLAAFLAEKLGTA